MLVVSFVDNITSHYHSKGTSHARTINMAMKTRRKARTNKKTV